jgi:invasion protein IalB
MKRFVTAILAVSVLMLPGKSAAMTRMALVIGNSTYVAANALPNPANDASALAKLFKDAKFDVVETMFDLSRDGFLQALREFADRSVEADVAVIYYAGHGMEMGGVNYLVPVDARLTTDTAVSDETVSLDRVLLAVDTAKRLRLVILDACRNNPFVRGMRRSRSTRAMGDAGLARVEVHTSDTYVAFAARAGSTADDSNAGDNHSPFAKALIDHLATPGLDIRIALGRVRDEVLKKTNGEQEPYVYGSLGGDIIALVPAKGMEPDANHASTPSPSASPRPVTKAQTLDLGTPISLHDNWADYCQRVGSADRCALAQSVRAEDGNFGLTAILLRGDRGQLMMRVIAPTGVLLASGLGLRVDEETIGNTGFVRCGEYGCVAEVEVDGALLKKLEAGKTAMFVIFQTPDAGLGVPISLSGLAAGLANLR